MNYDFDVIIIGAGIHGAGAAQAVAAAGHSVLVLEQYNQPAQGGSSSQSTKLIHGGLRYLETGQFHLVYECLQERSKLLRNAPHLVKLVPFYIPVYKDTTRTAWKIMAGLAVYSLFRGKLFKRIPRNQWDRLDGLRTADLEAVFSYYDAQTDDARLTRSVLASAQMLGAKVHTGTSFQSARLTAEGCEIICRYSAAGKKAENKKVSARILVNAAGSRANDVLQLIEPKTRQMAVELVQGTHIFSFGSYYDPDHSGVSALKVINDDSVQPGAGFAMHSHQDMEIISYVKRGMIEHKDSMGNIKQLSTGEFQLMSAGSGISQSEALVFDLP